MAKDELGGDLVEKLPEDAPAVKRWTSGLVLLGGLWLFAMRFLKTLARPPYEFKEIVRQLNAIGYRSLSLVIVVGIVIGAVLTMQSRPTMIKFGAEAYIPVMVAISSM